MHRSGLSTSTSLGDVPCLDIQDGIPCGDLTPNSRSGALLAAGGSSNANTIRRRSGGMHTSTAFVIAPAGWNPTELPVSEVEYFELKNILSSLLMTMSESGSVMSVAPLLVL